MELCSPAHYNISAITEDGSEMIRFIIRKNFIFSSFPYSYIVVDLTFRFCLAFGHTTGKYRETFSSCKENDDYFFDHYATINGIR